MQHARHHASDVEPAVTYAWVITKDLILDPEHDTSDVGVCGPTQAEQDGGAAEGDSGPRDGLPEVHGREGVVF